MLRHPALHKQHRLRRVDAGGQPVDHHFTRVLPDHMDFVVMGGQCMPVGDKKQAGVFGLQARPVLEHAVIMAKMQGAGGPHAG